jgi:hypothetical protein
MAAIQASMNAAKAQLRAMTAQQIQLYTAITNFPQMLTALTRTADKFPAYSATISNVPGPPVPLYLCGARIEALYPLGPVFHGAGLNITVLSNAGQLHVGAIACRESVPDTDALVQRFPAELATLKAAVAARDLTLPLRRRRGRKSAPAPEA